MLHTNGSGESGVLTSCGLHHAEDEENKMKAANILPFSALLLSSLGWSVTDGESTACKTSGVVLEGSPAFLTCLFSDTFKEVDKSFMVYRQKSALSKEVIVALCGWESGKLQCRNFEGFSLKSEENNRGVTFEVQSTQETHSGRYICKTLPAAEAEATECSLTVQKNGVLGDEIITCSTTSPALPGEQASVSCKFPESVGMNGIALEKVYHNNGKHKEEIARCNTDGKCTVMKHGYENDFKMPGELKVNIPHIRPEQAGIYVCKSPSLPGETGICILEVSKGKASREGRSFKQLLLPMYLIVGCLCLLLVIVAVATCLWYTVCRRARSTSNGESSRVGVLEHQHGGNSESNNTLLGTPSE